MVRRSARGLGAVAVVVLSVAVAAVVLSTSVEGAEGVSRQSLLLRDRAGVEVARVELTPGVQFALAYRNSLYGASAEERFEPLGDGTFRLVEVASDRLAVLEEYYRLSPSVDRGRTARLRWEHGLAAPPAFRELRVIADRLGGRTLLAGTRLMELWRLVPDGAVVRLTLEPESP